MDGAHGGIDVDSKAFLLIDVRLVLSLACNVLTSGSGSASVVLIQQSLGLYSIDHGLSRAGLLDRPAERGMGWHGGRNHRSRVHIEGRLQRVVVRDLVLADGDLLRSGRGRLDNGYPAQSTGELGHLNHLVGCSCQRFSAQKLCLHAVKGSIGCI